jgi:pimeloyl-ACP methyl ester carboxylesterase
MSFLQINGSDLYSEVQGDGEPVLFLHGGFCSLEHLRAQSDALAADHRVFAFERAGHGRSADVDGPFDYSRGVADTIAYLDAQGLESAHVIGYSDGAIIGLLLALEHPERVRSLISISANLDPAAFTFSEGEHGPVLDSPATPQPPPKPEDGNAAAEPKPDTEREHYDRLSPDGAEHADVVLGKLFTLWTSEPHIDPTELGRITARTLVMSGDRDTIRPDHSLLIAASIPAAQLCIVPGATHGLLAERPGLISTVIREFLNDVEG